jgi:hypothetical protein
MDPNDLQHHIATAVQQQVQAALAAMQPRLQAANGSMGSSGATPPRAQQGKIHESSRYAGTSSDLDVWLAEMSQLSTFYGHTTDEQHLAYAVAHLKGAALQWWGTISPRPLTTAGLIRELRTRFQPITSAESARLKLRNLTQGKSDIQTYVGTFNALLVHVPTMSMDDRVFAFIHGLNEKTQAHVNEVSHTTLETAIERAVRFGSRVNAPQAARTFQAPIRSDMMELDAIDAFNEMDDTAPPTAAELHAIREWRRAKNAPRPASTASSSSNSRRAEGAPSNLPVVAHLTPTQVKEYMSAGKCFSCGDVSHQSRQCPNKKKHKQGN